MLQRPPRPDRRRTAASARQSRWRHRARAGKIVVSIEVDDGVVELLIKTNGLTDRAAGDRGKIGKALAAMLKDAAR
jgi:hypothetical protein